MALMLETAVFSGKKGPINSTVTDRSVQISIILDTKIKLHCLIVEVTLNQASPLADRHGGKQLTEMTLRQS